MNTKKSRLNKFNTAIIVGMFSFLALTTSASSEAKPIVLKGITPWTKTYASSEPFFMFQRLIEERLKGKVILKYLGGPEVVPSFEQFEALRNGVVDVILGAAAYYTGQVPEASGMLLARKSSKEQRKSGYYDVMRKVHLDKGGVIYLSSLTGEPNKGFRLYLNKKIDKPDLSGLKIRVSPVYVPLVKGLGGTPINMKMSEVYTAMERGVVDGFGATYVGIMDFALHEVTKYVVDIPFYSKDNSILMNAKAFKSLPDDIRKELEKIAVEVENQQAVFITEKNGKEDAKIKKAGLKFIRFDKSGTNKYLGAAYNSRWDKFLKKSPEIGLKLRKLGG